MRTITQSIVRRRAQSAILGQRGSLTPPFYVGAVSIAPPLSSSYLAYYEGSLGVLDGSGNAQTTAFGVVGTWRDQGPNGYHRVQSNNALRPFYRSSSTPGLKVVPSVFPFADISIGALPSNAPIDRQSTSFFAIADYTRLGTRSVALSSVLWEIADGSGILRYDIATSSVGKLVWVDGAGTHDTGLRISSGWNLIGVVLSDSAVTIWVNDQSVSYAALSAGTSTGDIIGNNVANTAHWNGSYQTVVLYNTPIAGTDKTVLVDNWAKSRRVNYTTSTNPKIIVIGSSTAEGSVAEDWQGWAWQADYGSAVFFDVAFAGQTWTGIPDPLNYGGTNFYDITKLCIVPSHCGQNDLIAGQTAATVLANRNTVLGRLRAAGCMAIDLTITPSASIDGAGLGANRTAYNAAILASDTRRYANYVIQYPADLSDYTQQPPFSSDGHHLVRSGHALWVPQVQPAVDAILALQSQVTTKQAEWYFNGDYNDSTIYQRDLRTIAGSPSFSAGLGGQQRLTLVKASSQSASFDVASAGSNPGVFDWYPMTIVGWLTTTETAGGNLIANSDNAGLGFNIYLDTNGKIHADVGRQGGVGSIGSGASTVAVNDGVTRTLAVVVDAAGIRLYISPNSNAALLALDKSVAWTGTAGKFVPSSKPLRFGVDSTGAIFTSASYQAWRFYGNEARTLPQLQALQAIEGTAAPEAPVLALGSYTTGSMPVTCDVSLNNGSAITLWNFYIAGHASGGHSDDFILAGTSATPSFTYAVTDGLAYHIKCTAVNDIGESAYSNEITFIATTTMLSDTFTGANGTSIDARSPEIGGPWTVTGGFQIQGNKAKKSSVAATRNFAWATTPVTSADNSFSADITGADLGIITNVQDVDHCWQIWYSNIGTVYIYEQTAKETFVNRGSFGGVSAGFNLKVITAGDTINLYVNGVLRVTYTVANRPYKTNAKVGLATYTGSTGDQDNALCVP